MRRVKKKLEFICNVIGWDDVDLEIYGFVSVVLIDLRFMIMFGINMFYLFDVI